MTDVTTDREARALAIAGHGTLDAALAAGAIPPRVDLTLSEAVVLGLLRQGVTRYVGIFGHGSTDVAEVLRVYQKHGVLRTYPVRNEVEAAHAATALRWVTGEQAAVITSIGPGALQALAGSLAAASDGIGVWHLYADETTQAEGPNMQEIPGDRQERFLRLCSEMGPAYTLHTPEALPEALRRGLNAVDHPHRARPFFLLLPINTQPGLLTRFALDSLPTGHPPPLGAALDAGRYDDAARTLLAADRVVVRVGGGARGAGPQIAELLDLVDGFAVTSPIALGTLPYAHPRNQGVGGSKGSISGNHAMENADLLLAIGSRAVCQSDMSRTGYPQVDRVININTDPDAAMHYARTLALVGDAAPTLDGLIGALRRLGAQPHGLDSAWARANTDAKVAWEAFKAKRYENPRLRDDVWQREVLTQPAVLRTVGDWARERDAVTFFDAGDVQANGFQANEDDRLGRTFTETGASYMGFATSALLSSALADRSFYAVAMTGDGSFTMNPQALIDGVQHGARGVVVLLDNRRQGAISSLQRAQYGTDYGTNDQVEVDYVAWAAAVGGVRALHGGYTEDELRAALDQAYAHDGVALIHVPVYFGEDPLGGFGSFGRWNVGSWVASTQELRKGMTI
ncbi:acetolactate synthase [Paractinoplanes durhamensis]|uniref:Acetolactate synthase n=1 Tax=Paractinoplanes durhamensis TaxID=113563 RepID=A0ABQ3YUS4_9ACTN|nr:thiamine pyrophosphate-dependent enzyme [Actinoplanes durhamensis]GIE01094.1 acetolactate synthase [Actinoplanes durhamensis]